jgi:hypothetical protein
MARIRTDKKNKLRAKMGNKCNKCGEFNNLVIHHIKPVESGGSNSMHNLLLLCHACHVKVHKRYMTIDCPGHANDLCEEISQETCHSYSDLCSKIPTRKELLKIWNRRAKEEG